jgi:hypothetical protein
VARLVEDPQAVVSPQPEADQATEVMAAAREPSE